MSRQLNPAQIWSQVPVANRLVEVNTKTGFSLTAGSYAVTGTIQQSIATIIDTTASVTASISAVTLAKTSIDFLGTDGNNVNALCSGTARVVLTNTTTLTWTRKGCVTNNVDCGCQIVPYV